MKFFIYAIKGIFHAIKYERNIKLHLIGAISVITAGLYFHISYYEWFVILLCIAGVISTEMLNTAIEKLCDFINPTYNQNIKIIKDVSAGAVLIISMISAIIGVIIFLPKILVK